MNRFRQRGASRSAFTLIEIMIVVALIGLMATIAVPSLKQLTKKTGLRRAISDLREVFDNARRRAIFNGNEVTVMFIPLQKTFYVVDRGPKQIPTDENSNSSANDPDLMMNQDVTGLIPEDVTIELLDVNHEDFLQASWTRVRFFPNGRCDEFTLGLRSENNEIRWISLEPSTGFLKQTTLKP